MTAAPGERRHPPPTAADLRAFLDATYARGTLPGSDGDPVALAPHGLPEQAAHELRELAIAEPARQTLEVGLGLGLGTLSLCAALLDVGHPQGHHTVIEAVPGDFGGAGTRALQDSGAAGLVEQIHAESQLALPRLVDAGRAFDLALIDGDHRFEGVFIDLCFADRLVRPGGLVIVDDLWMPAVRHAVSYVERNFDWTLLPDATDGASAWSRPRHVPGRRLRGRGDMAVLRLPEPRPHRRAWDGFVPFA